MNIEFFDFVAGARKARGIVVVIDVFRAFTTACYCFQQGAQALIAVAEPEQALAESGRADTVLLGERFGKPLAGFDFGNSPSHIAKASLLGKTVYHTTHAGTQGLVNARGADEVLTGALVNARATAAYIRQRQPDQVSLVRMGLNASLACDEDWLCADYLKDLLLENPVDENGIRRQLEQSPFAARFFDPEQPWNPSEDFDCCLAFNHFDFVLRARPLGAGSCRLEKV